MFFDRWVYPRIVRPSASILARWIVPSLLFQLNTLVLADRGPTDEVADACYLFGQTADNQNSVLEQGIELFRRGLTSRIVICGNSVGYGYPGSDTWYRILRAKEIPGEAILRITTLPRRHPSTFSEAEALVRRSQLLGWKNVFVVASPHHQLRAFISTVSWIRRIYPELRAYSKPGAVHNWWKDAKHSQGILQGVRAELILDELAGIILYRLKGDLISPRAVIKYLKERDQC